MNNVIKLKPKEELPVIAIKIIEEQYVSDFTNYGIIHFSDPKMWRNKEICSGKQLDEYDGCFCVSSAQINKQLGRKGSGVREEYNNGEWRYFEDTGNIVGTCFYGMLLSGFEDSIMKYGVQTIPVKNNVVPNEYFKNFVEDIEDNHRVVIIFDFPRLLELIKTAVMQMGVSEDEFFVSQVYYVNKKVPYYVNERFPFEYFLKDSDFSEQAELRIIIATENKAFYNILNKNHGNITVGDISSFSVIQDKYTSDLEFSIQGNSLIYKLAKPVTLKLDDRSFSELVQELYQIRQNRLPGEPKNEDELESLMRPIIDHLRKKYGVVYRDDWRLYHVPFKEYQTLSDLYKGLCETIVY